MLNRVVSCALGAIAVGVNIRTCYSANKAYNFRANGVASDENNSLDPLSSENTKPLLTTRTELDVR